MTERSRPSQGSRITDPVEPELRRELISSSLGWSIFILALPVLGEQFFNILVGLFDTYLAGRMDKESISAVGLASYVGWLASMLSGLVGVGGTALVARSIGAGDRRQANRFTNQALGLAGFLGFLLACALLCASTILPRLMGMTPEASEITTTYLRIDAVGQFFYCYMLIGAASLRGAGDTRTPMMIMIVINLINVLVSAGLALGLGPLPRLGVVGIALGTVAARSLGGLIMLAVLARGRSGLRLRWSQMRVRREVAWRILRIGGPAGLDSAVMWSGHFIFLTFISRVSMDPEVGTAAYAAHMIGIRMESFTFLPATAWGVAAATLTGQALGAGDQKRARRTGHYAVLQLLPLGLVLLLLYSIMPEQIYALWSDDPGVQAQGAPALRLAAFAQPSLMTMIIYISALRGAGDTRFPLWFTLVGVFAVRIPLAYFLGVVAKGGLFGAWIGMCADLYLRSLLAAWRFSRGGWTSKEI